MGRGRVVATHGRRHTGQPDWQPEVISQGRKGRGGGMKQDARLAASVGICNGRGGEEGAL